MAVEAGAVLEALVKVEAEVVSLREDLRRLHGEMAALSREIACRLAERRPDRIGG